MAINFKEIQAGGTSTDINVSVEGLDLILEMSYYKSGLHHISRTGEDAREIITFDSSYGTNAKVSIYLVDSPETVEVSEGVSVTTNKGQFVIDICRIGIDSPYQPEGLIMYVGDFIIPESDIESLDEVEINAIKVVGGNE